MRVQDIAKINVEALLKNKNFLANVGVIIIALIITRNMHVSQVQKIESLKNQISNEDEISGIIDELRSSENTIDSLERGFAERLSSEIVIDTVSSLARQNGIRVDSISAKQVRDRDLYQQLPIDLQIKTSYHKLGHLISDIENTNVLGVESLRIVNKEQFYIDGPIVNNVALNLRAISLKKKQE